MEGFRARGAIRFMDPEDGADAAAMLAHDLLGLDLAEPRHLAPQNGDLGTRKQIGKNQETVAVELVELLWRQVHGASSPCLVLRNANTAGRGPQSRAKS